MAGPYPYPESPYPGTPPQQPLPPFGGPHVPSPYPGTLPPPVEYPKTPRRRRLVFTTLGVLLALVVGVVAATIVFAERGSQDSAAATSLTPDSAKAAIQVYLDALTQGKDEIIAEHASCGVFDAVKDKRADMALADLASETFRRQFSSAEVTTIDKIVELSPNQAQVLFSMDTRGPGNSGSGSGTERQAVAQLLIQGDQILVCSYLPRNAGPF